MITSIFGIEKEPFMRADHTLQSQQKYILDMIQIHSQQGGFSVVIGEPGVGKSVLREYIENFNKKQEMAVASCTRTLHTYLNILNQIAGSFQVEASIRNLEKTLIQTAFSLARERKTLYILIDDAHLLDMQVLRKLRLLFEQFPKKYNLVLFGQHNLLYYLSLKVNQDIKSRVTYSNVITPLNDEDMKLYIVKELESVRLGINTFDPAAIELILRNAQGNLRLCRNLCYTSLVEACRASKKCVTISYVNQVLIQPHWRSHDELIQQQAN